LMQAFGRALRGICPSEYVAGPDIGTNEQDMEEFALGNGSWQASTGKPTHVCKEPGVCGLPHELGSTGYGVAQAVAVAVEHAGINLRNATVAIEGFGNVGEFAARYLTHMGARLVAISDSRGCIYANDIDFEKLWQIKKQTGSVTNYPNTEIIPHEKIFELPVEILVPAALPDVITEANVNRVRAKIIVEGSNIPITEAAEQNLHERGALVVPDFVANAGGVISSYAEYEGKPLDHMFDLVKSKITANVKKILEEAKKRNVKPRDVALSIAKDRVMKAMKKSQ
jgi:glutamate dehydrogenase (NAD(P)+)